MRIEALDEQSTTKARIRAAAGGIFAKDGIEAMTMRAVAREVGISPTAIYRHYENQEAILQEIWSVGCADLAKSLNEPIESNDPTDRMLTLTHRYVSWALTQPEIFELMYRDNPYGLNPLPAGSGDDLTAITNNSIRALVREIENAIRMGRWRNEDKWQMAVAIWSLSRGLISLCHAGLVEMPREDLPAVACRSMAYLLRGFEVDATPQDATR